MKEKDVESPEGPGGVVWQAEHVQEFVGRNARMSRDTVSKFKEESREVS